MARGRATDGRSQFRQSLKKRGFYLSFLFDSNPYGFIAGFGFYYFLFQAVKPDATIKYLSHLTVLAYQYAPLGVFGGVASMDAYALKLRYAE